MGVPGVVVRPVVVAVHVVGDRFDLPDVGTHGDVLECPCRELILQC